MGRRTVVMAAAWLEIIVGVTLIAVPDLPSRLLFAAMLDGVGVPIARFAGIGLVALGVACVPSKSAPTRRGAVAGLLVFNAGVTILLFWVAVATTFRGLLLWPVVILHAIIAAALLSQFLTGESLAL